MTAHTAPPGIPDTTVLPRGARGLVSHEGGGTFLGWTFCTLSTFTRRISWYFIRPEGTLGARCADHLEALNCLRGPAGLPALIDEY